MLRLIRERERRAIRRERIFRDRFDPIDSMREDLFMKRYRFPKNICIDFCRELSAELQHPTERNHALTVSMQVRTALRFFASGNNQSSVWDNHHISVSSASRCINSVSSALAARIDQHVYFPNNLKHVKAKFFEKTEFPGVIESIDGTHVRISRPSINENIYVNRKGFHSINAMLVCDWDMIINNCVARFPGGTHDSYVLHSSALGREFERNPPNSWLLGDSGYPSKRWIMTPLGNAQTRQEKHYQRRQCKARSIIERCNVLLKERFRCLRKELHYTPAKASMVIQSYCALHNVSVRYKLPVLHDPDSTDDDSSDSDAGDDEFPPRYNDMNGNQIREELVATL
ncbi:putative nuclease HARBI1 [Lineus longissimus]|uniref:putative nuclease HARBI1 n=1 Tax=Lineus longissimus TaxID=88925 RepID=UPI00315D782D